MSNIDDDTIKLLGILFSAWAVSHYVFVKDSREGVMLQLPSRWSSVPAPTPDACSSTTRCGYA
ncbi:hypothetical protein CVT26_007876 [Gymnopilus dilepis]|uniref:Uncharacterized protein n=1 Tax=Gymnopilus dilepis TaxID=231916 RepID=A0A409YK96_9AGAR|nr:hypothetical protein CVT26_007876 [Gymnopilus dilepis]